MKLCITAAGNSLSAPVDSAFGRAPWFMLIDTESGAAEAVANTSADAAQGAGIAAAQLMAARQVDAVLTGRLGPKAQAALAAVGIAMHEGLGRCAVSEALEQFRAGQYPAGGAAASSAPAAAPAQAAAEPSRQGRSMGGGGGRGGQGCGRCGGGRGRR